MGMKCSRSVVAVGVTGSPFAEGPVKFLVWDLSLFVSSVLLAVFVVVWAMFFGTIDPIKFGVEFLC
jgi:hypothetical protein